MHETAEDLEALQQLLDRSDASAGAHLRSIITPDRRVSAVDLAARLTGMTLLALATVTADGRPLVGPVNGVFYRGAFHFSSSPDSVRMRHLRSRPSVGTTHVPGEHFAVTVHGRAIPIDLQSPDEAAFRRTVLEVYEPRYGAEFETFLDSGPVYARIEAARLFAMVIEAGEPSRSDST